MTEELNEDGFTKICKYEMILVGCLKMVIEREKKQSTKDCLTGILRQERTRSTRERERESSIGACYRLISNSDA